MEPEPGQAPSPAPRPPRLRRDRPRALIAVAVVALLAALALLVFLLLSISRPPAPRPAADEEPGAAFEFVKAFANKDGSPLRNPLGVAVAGDRVYVTEADAGVIRVFSAEGDPLSTLPLPRRSDGVRAYPSAIADLGRERIGVVDLSGNRVFILSTAEADAGRVSLVLDRAKDRKAPARPTAIVANGDGFLVGDSGDHVLREYDVSGDPVRNLGGDLKPQLTFIGGLASDGDSVFVSDSNAGRVVRIPLAAGPESILPVRFTLPRGVCVSPAGLLVADQFARQASLYAPSGKMLETLRPPDKAGWSPAGVTWMEASRRFYVTEPTTGKVLVFGATTE